MQQVINTSNYRYLKFTNFNELGFWDYYTLSHQNEINSAYKIVELRTVLKQRKEIITINDNQSYKRCRVQIQGKGVVLRDKVLGKEIKTKKQQLCKPNDFLVAEIDAKVGGFGIVPKELEDAVVSSHYFLFDIDTSQLLPEFLGVLVKTNGFLKQVKSTGSTNYSAIRPYHVLGYKIPLPSIKEQENILKEYNSKISKAVALKSQADNIELEIEKYFLDILGVEKNTQKTVKKGLQIFQFKDFTRWDVWVNQSLTNYKNVKPIQFKEIVIGKPMYGANVKGVQRKSDTRYIRITDINENGTLNDEFVSPEIVDDKFLLKENDFLIARSGNTVGKTFLYKEQYGKAIYAGYLVKYNIDTSKVAPEYLLEYTKSYTFKNWIHSNQRVAGQPNINGQEYLQAPIICPSMEEQMKIVKEISAKRELVQNIIKDRDYILCTAQIEFEQKIFDHYAD
ncbi:hypothetical protein HGH90_11985 [Chitinophaga sp. Ak27]|nr:hypothetical protein [Chitinophaga sp. Ak27]